MLNEIRIGIKHWWIIFKKNIRVHMEYKESFLAWLLVSLGWAAVFMMFWYVIFQKIPSINGWTFAGSMLMLGYVELAQVFWSMLFESYDIPEKIVVGELDSYLARPIAILPSLWARGSDISAVMNLIPASIYFYLALQEIPLANFMVGLIYAFAGFAILGSIELSLASLSFWFGRVREVLNLFFNALFAQVQFPIAIYPPLWKLLFCIVIPTGLMQSVPAQVALDPASLPENLVILVPMLVGWIFVASIMWKEGLKRYESAGG